jgi:hypothetical protein
MTIDQLSERLEEYYDLRTCPQISCRICRNRLAPNSRDNRVLTHSGWFLIRQAKTGC